MGSLTCAEMRQLETDAFERGATPEGLMEKAGRGIADAIMRRYPRPSMAIACVGTGNNGGDALVALRYLADRGWKVGIRCVNSSSDLRALPRKKWRELADVAVNEQYDHHSGQLVLLDGLLGIGAEGPLRKPLSQLAAWMNHARVSHSADTIAMDIPSGVNGDTGEVYAGSVIADLTLTIGVAKSGLFADSAVNYVGAIESIPLEELPEPNNANPCLIDVHCLRGVMRRRPHDFHKGNAGRVGVLAGSKGMLGAAVLCAQGALRGGSGLITIFSSESLYPILAPMLPPEVMLKPISSLAEILEAKLDAFAVGPGLGDSWDDADFFQLLNEIKCPTVVDADGLNRMAAAGLHYHVRSNMVLTPHPGEMARLFPDLVNQTRLESARAAVEPCKGATLLLKGARSVITRGDEIHINGSGNPGMATGGQGDVLTGVVAALLAQGLDQLAAARMGAWLCGRAAELVVSHGDASMESLSAGDIPDWLGRSFREIT